MDGSLRPTRSYFLILTLVAAAGIGGIYLGLTALRPTHWFCTHDIRVYYQESQWADGPGTLYEDIGSEYPLLANGLFAACRLVSDCWRPLGTGFNSYALVWISGAWFVYLWVGHQFATRINIKAVWLWLAPGAVFFALFRFDIYPTASTLLALLALREERYLKGAFWVGLTIALKGYALFALPALLVFVLQNRGRKTTLQAVALCLGPMLLANLVVLSYAGLDGMLSPYRFHTRRVNFGESSYDAFYYLTAFLFDGPPHLKGTLPAVLQLACAFGAAALRPRTFAELVNAVLVALLGFMSFSVFYSPQYVLWVLPVAAFTADRTVRRLALAFGWLTFLYYPVFHVAGADAVTLATAADHGGAVRLVLFRACVVLVTVIRFGMTLGALRALRAQRQECPHFLVAVPARVGYQRECPPPAASRLKRNTNETWTGAGPGVAHPARGDRG